MHCIALRLLKYTYMCFDVQKCPYVRVLPLNYCRPASPIRARNMLAICVIRMFKPTARFYQNAFTFTNANMNKTYNSRGVVNQNYNGLPKLQLKS